MIIKNYAIKKKKKEEENKYKLMWEVHMLLISTISKMMHISTAKTTQYTLFPVLTRHCCYCNGVQKTWAGSRDPIILADCKLDEG